MQRAKAVTWVLAAMLAPGCGLPRAGLAQPDSLSPSDSSSPAPDAAAASGHPVSPPSYGNSGAPDAEGGSETGGDPMAPDAGDDASRTEGGPGDTVSGDAGDDRPTAAAAPVLVQKASMVVAYDVRSSVRIPLPQAQLPGDLVVVIVGWDDSLALVSGVSDDAGDDFALTTDPTVYRGLLSQSIYYAKNVAAAASNAITVQFDSPASDPDIRVLEYGGLDPVDPLDVATGAIGRGTTTTVGPITTTAPGLLVAATTVQTVTGVPGPEWTVRFLTQPNGDLAADRFVATPGSYTGQAPLMGSGQWVMQLAAFRTR